jgi:hypothetical protein
MTNSGHASVGSLRAYSSSASVARLWPTSAHAATLRRSKRSATVPVTSTSIAAGANSTRPSRPSASLLSVMSYSCLASTAICRKMPIDVANCAATKWRT